MIYNKINAGRGYVKKLENNLKEDNDHPFKDVIITEIKEINNELEEQINKKRSNKIREEYHLKYLKSKCLTKIPIII